MTRQPTFEDSPLAVLEGLLDAVVDADRDIATATVRKARLLNQARRVHDEANGTGASMVYREFLTETALALRITGAEGTHRSTGDFSRPVGAVLVCASVVRRLPQSRR